MMKMYIQKRFERIKNEICSKHMMLSGRAALQEIQQGQLACAVRLQLRSGERMLTKMVPFAFCVYSIKGAERHQTSTTVPGNFIYGRSRLAKSVGAVRLCVVPSGSKRAPPLSAGGVVPM